MHKWVVVECDNTDWGSKGNGEPPPQVFHIPENVRVDWHGDMGTVVEEHVVEGGEVLG